MAPAGKTKSGRKDSGKAAAVVKTPDWPAFKPLLPASDLSLETVAESQIVVIRNFWTSTLCKNYVTFLKTLDLVTTPGKPKKGDAVRVNDRFQVTDPAFANRLWIETGLRDIINGRDDDTEGGISEAERRELWGGEVIGLNPSIRVYRYTPGQFFDQHYDESNMLSFPSTPPIPAKTTWTMLLYLTSSATGCKGGQTVFYPDDIPNRRSASAMDKEIIVELETGMLLLHKHGNDCMLHEGREVTEGEKWLIRSDLCIKR